MPRLVVLRDGTVWCQVELGLQDLVIGRAEDSDIVLDDPSKAVSRHHAEVRVEDDRYVMIDVGSENGIWQGTNRVDTAELTHGTVLSVGSFDIRFEDDIDDAPTTAVRDPDPSVTWLPAAGQTGAVDESTRSGDESSSTTTGAPVEYPPPPVEVPLGRVRPGLGPAVSRSTGRAREGRWPVVQRGASGWRGVAGRLAQRRKAVLAGAGLGLGVVVLAVAFGQAWLRPPKPPGGDRAADQLAAQLAEKERQRHLGDARGALDKGMLREAHQSADEALALAPANGEARDLHTRIEELISIEAAPKGDTPHSPPPGGNTAQNELQKEHVRPQPEVTPWPLLAGRPGETKEALRERSRLMFERYRHAESLLRAGRLTEADVALAAIAAEEPSYEAVATLLLEARQGIAAQVTTAVDAGSALERDGDLAAAMAQYERARQLDPALTATEALIRQLRERMAREGADLYTRAKQYDALGRSTEAADLYDRVLKLLPSDDPRYGVAQARIKVIRTGGR